MKKEKSGSVADINCNFRIRFCSLKLLKGTVQKQLYSRSQILASKSILALFPLMKLSKYLNLARKMQFCTFYFFIFFFRLSSVHIELMISEAERMIDIAQKNNFAYYLSLASSHRNCSLKVVSEYLCLIFILRFCKCSEMFGKLI